MKDRSEWRRLLLKLSGEALAEPGGEQISGDIVQRLAKQIVEVRETRDVDIAVVVGGGNIWRGATGALAGMDRAQSDYMGMLATMINALALQDALEQLGQQTRVLSAIQMAEIAEPYIRRRAMRHLEKGRVVIFGSGTGNPYFTTDTAAALRAAEIEADVVLRGTHSGVDGVYTADPRTTPDAKKLDRIDFVEVFQRDLQAMDQAAIAVCRENGIPIVVFDLLTDGNIGRILDGEPVGTVIT
jgi:uridylate kinase